MLRPSWLVVLLLTAVAPSATRADIILGTVDRHVIARFQGVTDMNSNATAGLYAAVVMVDDPSAEQVSDIQPLSLAGAGLASMSNVNVNDPDALAESVFDVFFTLTAPHSFNLIGELVSDVEAGNAIVDFLFTGPSANYSFTASSGSSEFFADSGTLTPGLYHVVASARMAGSPQTAGGFFLFALQLIPPPQVESVPEPASLAVWGLAAAVAAATGWANRSRRH